MIHCQPRLGQSDQVLILFVHIICWPTTLSMTNLALLFKEAIYQAPKRLLNLCLSYGFPSTNAEMRLA